VVALALPAVEAFDPAIPTADPPCWPTTSSGTASPSGSASMSGLWPIRPSWTRSARSAPTSTGCYGRGRSRQMSGSPGTSMTSKPAWLPPLSTRSRGS